MPIPVSRTMITTDSASAAELTVTLPPGGVNFTALVSRWSITRCSCSASPATASPASAPVSTSSLPAACRGTG